MPHDDERPDDRWTLAVERTVLARVRWSAGLLVAGFLVAFGPLPVPSAVGSVLGAASLLGATWVAVTVLTGT